MSTQEYIRSITELTPDDFPTTRISTISSANSDSSGYFSWQTWLIIILILALFGINVFAYLAKGTEETASIFSKVFEPILAFFGYNTLTTTKQTLETSATGTKAGVDIVANTATGAIDTVMPTSGTSVGVSTEEPKGYAPLRKGEVPVRRQANENIDEWQQDSLERALNDASQNRTGEPLPNDSIPTGKAGWCFIGEDNGIRSCSEIGVNDMCMSGDIFPTQAVCMNPNLRA